MRRDVRLILGFSPGSASDEVACAIVPALSAQLDCAITIERRLGENGAKAARSVAETAPDGRTLFMATLGTHALAPHFAASIGYDPLTDFAPISLITRSPLVLACHPGIPATSVRELIDLARRHPGAVTYGSSAIGGAPHLAGEFFQAMTDLRMRHVRYDETEQLYRDLESGVISLSFNNVASMMRRCRAGTLRALGVSSSQRASIAPDLPTIAECGLRGYEVTNWLGLVAPRGTPDHIVGELSAALQDLRFPELAATGIEFCPTTADEFGRFIATELERWGPVVRRLAVRSEREESKQCNRR